MENKIKIPFYKYKVKISKINIQNVFDWLYARTCIQLNKKNKRFEYDCSDVVKSEIKEQLKPVLDEKIIDKIAQNLNKKFLENSIQEVIVDEKDLGSKEYTLYQDGISGTFLPIMNNQDKMFYFDNSLEKSVNKFNVCPTDVDGINQIKSVISDFLAENDNIYIDLQQIKVCIINIDKNPVYADINLLINNNKIDISSDFKMDEYKNNIWFERLRNSGNKQVIDIISKIEDEMKKYEVSFEKTKNMYVVPEYHLRNTKLDEIYQESCVFSEDIKNIVQQKLKEAAANTWTVYTLKQILGDTISKITDTITKNLPDIITEDRVKNDIRRVRNFYDREDAIFKQIVDQRRFKKNAKAMFILLCIYAPKFAETESEMNYYSFYDDACRINEIRNNATHNERDLSVKEMTKYELIEIFNKVCKFLITLYKKQNNLGE